MFAKKALPRPSGTRTFRKELEYLYARRTAVDTLIHSLEEYNRFRPQPAIVPSKRRPA